jgi:hypothetical protein
MKYHQIVFLSVTSAKGMKTDEKQLISLNLQFQSPNFYKLAKLVPGNLKLV